MLFDASGQASGERIGQGELAAVFRGNDGISDQSLVSPEGDAGIELVLLTAALPARLGDRGGGGGRGRCGKRGCCVRVPGFRSGVTRFGFPRPRFLRRQGRLTDQSIAWATASRAGRSHREFAGIELSEAVLAKIPTGIDTLVADSAGRGKHQLERRIGDESSQNAGKSRGILMERHCFTDLDACRTEGGPTPRAPDRMSARWVSAGGGGNKKDIFLREPIASWSLCTIITTRAGNF